MDHTFFLCYDGIGSIVILVLSRNSECFSLHEHPKNQKHVRLENTRAFVKKLMFMYSPGKMMIDFANVASITVNTL